MNKNIIIKSLINGVVSFFVVALVLDLVKGIPFGQALVNPFNIFLCISAIVGSFIGFSRKEKRK